MLISALVFSAVHLTNIAGLDLVSLALQVIYSFVIGLVLAAVYLRNESLLQVIFTHFLTDFSNRIFIEQASSTTTLQLILFVLLLLAETVYAFQLIRLIKGNIQMFSSEDKR
jgi:membrane protease YdiL (CAAX protease family)